jgi:hypothetical protein
VQHHVALLHQVHVGQLERGPGGHRWIMPCDARSMRKACPPRSLGYGRGGD